MQDAVLQRSYAAEPILALACSLDGQYCAGGGPSGSIHLWEAPSGRLLRSWPAHYKARCLLPLFPQKGLALPCMLCWITLCLMPSASTEHMQLAASLC